MGKWWAWVCLSRTASRQTIRHVRDERWSYYTAINSRSGAGCWCKLELCDRPPKRRSCFSFLFFSFLSFSFPFLSLPQPDQSIFFLSHRPRIPLPPCQAGRRALKAKQSYKQAGVGYMYRYKCKRRDSRFIGIKDTVYSAEPPLVAQTNGVAGACQHRVESSRTNPAVQLANGTLTCVEMGSFIPMSMPPGHPYSPHPPSSKAKSSQVPSIQVHPHPTSPSLSVKPSPSSQVRQVKPSQVPFTQAKSSRVKYSNKESQVPSPFPLPSTSLRYANSYSPAVTLRMHAAYSHQPKATQKSRMSEMVRMMAWLGDILLSLLPPLLCSACDGLLCGG
ncbi:hypothetical protein K458DRAFT_145348 [Lentithecium fluviatile CBS 122367]|uniref:Uncharacterized protein n=1 Tax=Lentithecium fluviatile CBS 122367 TaxID=1168545 RepID=A0A6G1II26_9PLEO|nr:hypothetical protein K458DRAFT_145348 [Lentithecium fluviatile CBS 122367]